MGNFSRLKTSLSVQSLRAGRRDETSIMASALSGALPLAFEHTEKPSKHTLAEYNLRIVQSHLNEEGLHAAWEAMCLLAHVAVSEGDDNLLQEQSIRRAPRFEISGIIRVGPELSGLEFRIGSSMYVSYEPLRAGVVGNAMFCDLFNMKRDPIRKWSRHYDFVAEPSGGESLKIWHTASYGTVTIPVRNLPKTEAGRLFLRLQYDVNLRSWTRYKWVRETRQWMKNAPSKIREILDAD